MKIQQVIQNDLVDFSNIPPSYYLLGLLSAFENRFQAMADKDMGEISWKQFFAIICIDKCKQPPTLNELSEILGSSHQNVKQILNKLENKGFVTAVTDKDDRRKQRIKLTAKCRRFCEKNDEPSKVIIGRIFDGIKDKDLAVTIQTIIKMERNLESL